MLKNLLVHIPSERPVRPVVDGAISLTVTHAAHLDAISVGYEITNVALAVDGGAAIAAVYDLERERALERANAALAVFETEARNAGIAYSCRPLTANPASTSGFRSPMKTLSCSRCSKTDGRCVQARPMEFAARPASA